MHFFQPPHGDIIWSSFGGLNLENESVKGNGVWEDESKQEVEKAPR